MKQITLSLLLLGLVLFAKAQNDTVWIDEVTIESTKVPAVYSQSSRIVNVLNRMEIRQAPIQNVSDLLEYAMNVDVRQRGYHGIQSDISVRGGTFDQVLILINGIPFNDPQTGHHNSDIPIEIENIEKVEVLEGPGSRIFGPNAFSGAINIITTNEKENKMKIGASAGEHNLQSIYASVNLASKNFSNQLSVSRNSSDGYINNTDYEILNVLYNAGMTIGSQNFEFQAAYQDKGFGANSFYTPSYPNQYEATNTLFFSGKWKGGNKIKHQLSAYYKKHNDRFELFRGFEDAASWYSRHNFHQTHVYGFEDNLNMTTTFGKTALGIAYRDEKIFSTNLGFEMDDPKDIRGEDDVKYSKEADRNNVSLFLDHAYHAKKFSVGGGVLANFNTSYGWEVFPGFDASYSLTKTFKVFASINKSYRVPSFTDLYYVGPTNIGNANLQPETAITIEWGLKYFTDYFAAEAAYFDRDGDNIIDWVKLNTDDKWESKNITELDTRGIEFSFFSNKKLFENLPFINRLRITYAYIAVKKSSGDFISKYALDYLKHKLNVNINHQIANNLSLNWQFSYQDRAGSYNDFENSREENYEPFMLIDARLNWEKDNWIVYLEATNMLNEDYFDIGNVTMPRRWIRAGFIFDIKL